MERRVSAAGRTVPGGGEDDDFDLIGLLFHTAVLEVIHQLQPGVELHGALQFVSPDAMGSQVTAGALVANHQTHLEKVRQQMRSSTAVGAIFVATFPREKVWAERVSIGRNRFSDIYLLSGYAS